MAQTGGIRVRVLESEDQSPLPGATVTLSNTQRLVAEVTVISDGNGVALFPILKAGGSYVVEASMPGFGARRLTDLRVHANSTIGIDVTLGQQIQERLEVVSQRTVVDLDALGNTTRFSDEFIQDLPQPGRFYQDLLALAPGVNDPDGDGNPNVHGARTRDFRAEVSGVSNVDPLTGQWLSRINPDSIEEMEIIPLGAGVEFGRAQGGFARIIQKQGTNEIEGAINFLYRGSDLDGEGAGNLGPADQKPDFQTIQPAIQVSGPLIKDKLWFRLSHEYVKREDPVNLLGSLSVQTREQWLNADQITWQASPRNKLAFQYQNDPLSVEGLDISSRVPLESSRTLERSGPTYSLTWTAPQSERVLFESTLAWQDHSVDIVPTAPEDQIIQQDCVSFRAMGGLNKTRCENLTSGFVSGPYFEKSLDDRRRLTVRGQATIFAPLGSHSHRLKLGLIVENEKYFRELDRKPDLTAEIIEPLFGDPYALASARIALPRYSSAEATGTNWAAYLEDQWKPADNLSVTLGLRVDREEITSLGRGNIDATAEGDRFVELIEQAGIDISTIPIFHYMPGSLRVELRDLARKSFTKYENIYEMRQQLAEALGISPQTVRLNDIMFKSQLWETERPIDDIYLENTNFAPRLSVAWDPWRNGKTKLAFSAGRYYDKTFLAVPLVELEPVETVLSFIGTLRKPVPPYVYTNSENIVYATPLTARMVDRDLRTPYQDEIALSFERELGTETSIKLSYLRREFKDQLQDVDINAAPDDLGACAFNWWPIYAYGVQPSPGEGRVWEDPLTGQYYHDTDPGIGDGRIDDCSGGITQVSWLDLVNGPDGRPDLYLQNPAWRELLLLSNFNASEYEALVLEIVRRQYRNWQLEASYTYSEAVGDAEDFDLLLGNQQNLRDDEYGHLSYDQRHIARVNFTGVLRGGFRVGTVIRWESGLPFSILESSLLDFNAPWFYPYTDDFAALPNFRYPTGQRNDHRNPSFWTIDLRLAKDFQLSRKSVFQISLDVFNAMNDDTLELESRTDYRQVGSRRFGRQWQIGLRLTF